MADPLSSTGLSGARSDFEIPRLHLLGQDMEIPHTFFRGETTNFLPDETGLEAPTGLAEHVLSGWMPQEPFIDADTTIIAFGSCFAGHIGRYLQNLGFDVATKKEERAYVSGMGDGIVNSHAIRQQFEWAWEGRTPAVSLWHGYKAEEFGYDEDIRLLTKELFDKADVFILTLGLSEVWYDEPTGEVFWRAVPYERYDPARHKFRLVGPAENLENLKAIYALIRKHRPEAAIVFTVSPIPLTATFRPVSCITANAVSKANLRSAVDELLREFAASDPRLFYFPSYEVITFPFRNVYTGDLRHPHFHLVTLNMKAFERYFCKTGMTDADLSACYLEALALDRKLGSEQAPEAIAKLERDLAAWIETNPGVALRNAKESERKQAAGNARRQVQAERQAERQALLDEQQRRKAEREALRAERVARLQARSAPT